MPLSWVTSTQDHWWRSQRMSSCRDLVLVQRTYAQYKGESRPKPCMISCLEETRKYPNSRMDVFPDQKKSLNKLSKKKKLWRKKKWTFNDKQILWFSLYNSGTQSLVGLMTKSLNRLPPCERSQWEHNSAPCLCHWFGKELAGCPPSPLSHPAVWGCMIYNGEGELMLMNPPHHTDLYA